MWLVVTKLHCFQAAAFDGNSKCTTLFLLKKHSKYAFSLHHLIVLVAAVDQSRFRNVFCFRLPSMERLPTYLRQPPDYDSVSRDSAQPCVETNLSRTCTVVKNEYASSSHVSDVGLSSPGNEYPPNIAISPGSCKSPYCCTSPGFCNFPFHSFKTRHCASSTAGDAAGRTAADPFSRDQVFVPDSADPEEIELSKANVPRRFSVPLLHDPLPIIKPDQLSLPELNNQGSLIDPIAPTTSLSASSSPTSSTSSIFTDNLLGDVTNNDVMVLLRSPKQEIIEADVCFDKRPCEPSSMKTSSLPGGKIRRSPPPPNVTLSPGKHLRNVLPPGN